MNLINLIWYQKINIRNFLLIIFLFPFSCLFYILSLIRRLLFRFGFKRQFKSKVPLVIIGGVSVGGSGKTPFCIALIKHLCEQGLKVGVLSRGYHSKNTSYPVKVELSTDAKICGDEPLLMKMSSTADTCIFVDPKREGAIRALENEGVDVILSDDGLQHYAMQRDIEIVVLDAKRMLGNGLLLPAGPNREGMWHVKKADFVVVNGKNDTDYHTMILKANQPVSLKNFLDQVSDTEQISKFTDVIAMSGIGNPQRFYNTLKEMNYNIADTLNIADHAVASDRDILLASEKYPVLMTAKDAVKYSHLKECKNLYVVTVNGHIDDEFFESFDRKLFDLLKK